MNLTKIRIKSDGTVTSITDAATGQDLAGVTEVKLELRTGQPAIARITQYFQIVELDVPAELETVTVQPGTPLRTR